MAVTVTEKKRIKFGNAFAVVADVAFDSSYPTGGEAVAAGLFGLSQIDFVLPSTAAGYMFEFDHTNSKLKALVPRAAISSTLGVTTPALTHASGATAVTSSAATVPDHAAGGACTISGVAGVAAGAGAEVANTTDLSAVTVRVVAIGI